MATNPTTAGAATAVLDRPPPAVIAGQLVGLADASQLWTPPAKPTAPDLTETESGMADRVAFVHADDLRYDWRIGRWLRWRAHSWQSIEGGEVERLVLNVIRGCWRERESMTDYEDRQRRAKFLTKCESAASRAAVARLTRSVLPVSDNGDGWDLGPDLLGVRNGVLHLPTATLRDGKPDDRITLALDLDYDADATAPRWERFIGEVFPDPDLAAFIQRAIGYSLTGHVKEQCFFMLHGKGSNGKSVLLGVLARLLGPLYSTVPFSTFLAQHYGSAGPTNDQAGLVGKRVVSASETAEGSHLNEARLKAMTGGDPITARFLNHEFFTFHPSCKIWLSVNHQPQVADDSLGFWRRVRLIPFERTFEGAEVDPDLGDKLALELPGILAWAVGGAVEWYAGGLRAPALVSTQTAAYQREQDPLDGFLSAACDLRPDYRAGGGELAAAYNKWADSQKYGPRDRMTATRLGRLLGQRFKRMPTRSGRLYSGLQVRASRVPGDEPDILNLDSET